MKHNRRTPKLLAGLLTLAMLLTVMAVFTIGAAAAAPLKRSYVFYQADASMLDEATENKFIKADAWANIPWSEWIHCFEVPNAVIDAADPNFGGRFQAMWSADGHLYYHIVVKDTSLNKTTDGAWNRDGFIMAISETGAVMDYNSQDCRKTSTLTAATTEGSNNGFDYSVVRDDTTGTIEIQARYTFIKSECCVAGQNILLEIMLQNNLLDDGSKYQKNGWNSTKNNHYNSGGSTNFGKGILSPVMGNAPVVLKYGEDIIGLVGVDAENKATLPASYTKINETLVYDGETIRVDDATYSNALLKLVGWKKDATTTYTPGEVITVTDPIVLTAEMEEIAVDETMDVILKSDGVSIASFDKDYEGNVTLPADANGKAIAAWKAADGKLYAPGATIAVVGEEQIVLDALSLDLKTQTGAAALIKDPTAIRFGGTLAEADLTAYGASIKGAGVIIVKADLLTSDILADGSFTAAELTEANIAFDDVAAAEVAASFTGVKENITELTAAYAAIAYVELQYEGEVTGRVYSTYDQSLHCRSIAQIAEKAYADRVESKTDDYCFRVSKAYAVEPDFPGRSYSLYTWEQLDLLKSFYATESAS